MKYLILYFLLLPYIIAQANVQSTTGTINFDADNDTNYDMVLNTDGLGIGTTPSSNLHVSGNAIISSKFSIGTNSSNSTVHINGTLGYSIQTVSSNTSTGNTTLGDNSFILADTNTAGANIRLYLPSASNVIGRLYTIKNTGSTHDVSIIGLIDDSDKVVLAGNSTTLTYIKLISSGSQWYILDISDGSSADTIASGNLTGHWKLDETSGTSATDSSSNSNTGTFAGGTFASQTVTGKINRGVDLTTSNGYNINIGDKKLSSESGKYISIFIWCKVTSTGGNRGIFSKWGEGGSGMGWALVHDGYHLRSKLSHNGTTLRKQFQYNNVFTDGNWHHIGITWDGSTGDLQTYVDGAAVAPDAIHANGSVTTIYQTSANIQIGCREDSTGAQTLYCQGMVDDARIYNKVLTSEEVFQLYEAGN